MSGFNQVVLVKLVANPLKRKPMDKRNQATGSAETKIKAKFGRKGDIGVHPYSSKIIKAGALLPDTKVLFPYGTLNFLSAKTSIGYVIKICLVKHLDLEQKISLTYSGKDI